jgi:hypothetical protein
MGYPEDMRLPPLLLGLPLTAGCLDFDRASVTFDIRQARGTVASEWRDEGIHHELAGDCATVDECRTTLQELACKQVKELDVTTPANVGAAIEVREDGRLDVVWSYQQPIEAAMQDWRDEGIIRTATLKPGREGEGPFAVLVGGDESGDARANAEVVRGRFDRIVLGEPDEGGDVWVLRSTRGTIRLWAQFVEQVPSDASAWPSTIPGLLPSLRDAPITCTPDGQTVGSDGE